MTNKDSSNKKLYNLIEEFMESWPSAIAMDLMLARSEEPKLDTPEFYAILYGAIDCCGQVVGADEDTTMVTASVFFHHGDEIGGIEYCRKIFDTQKKPELRKWIVESGQAVKDFIDGSKDAGQAFIPLAEKYRIAVSDIENTKKKGYEGEMKDGKPHGRGIYIWSSGNVYEGEWKEGKQDGKGTITLTDGSFYEGEWKDNFMQGQGTKTWPNGQKYVGEWKEGDRYGKGTITLTDGSFYEGEWKNDEKHGQGTLTYPSGGKYVGEWREGKQDGQGTQTWSNGDTYEGGWREDKQDGQGTQTWSNGDTYEGGWREGKQDGQGTQTWSNGSKYEGEWKGGVMWNSTLKDGNNIDYENGLQKQSDKKGPLYVQPTLFDVVDDQDTSED